MTPERYRRVDELVAAALDLEAGKREAFLNEACVGDESVLREVESLIAANEQTDETNFLGTPAADWKVFAHDQATSELSSGQMILSGRYQIERELGRGGIGVVYLARDLKLHSRFVVIKVLQQKIGQKIYWERKFDEEIKALARFDNPRIVGIHDAGEFPNGDRFFVMSYVEGVDLRSVMKGRRMDLGRIARIVQQIGQALTYAHERFVIHRDLKPENIMLRVDEDFAVLIDFGIATVKASQLPTRSLTRGATTFVVGTPPYIAPEQLVREPSPASDTYALGVIAYEMATGELPFKVQVRFEDGRANPLWGSQLYDLQRAGAVVNPIDLRPDLPEPAQALILRALSFDPCARHSRAQDFGEQLAATLAGKEPRPFEEASTVISTPIDGATPSTMVRAGPRPADVVISYDSQDLRAALELAGHLKSAGVTYWMADHGREVNLDDRSQTIQAVKCCKVVLLLCSDAALQSRAVKQEMQFAWSYERPFLPLLIEPPGFPEQSRYWLEGKQWIETMDAPTGQWLPQLLRALANLAVPCPAVDPATFEGVSLIEPTRLNLSLKSLHSIARLTDQIWPVPAERIQRGAIRSALRDLAGPQGDVQHGYHLGSRVCLAIESDREGHLLLLDEGTSGKTYCVCPSWFAPSTHLRAGCSYLPQIRSRYDSFVVTGKPGREHLLAILSDDPLGLDWLPSDPRIPARVLNQADIDLLLARLRGSEATGWVAMSTYFEIVA